MQDGTSAVVGFISFPDSWRITKAASAAFNFESFLEPAATGLKNLPPICNVV